VEHVLTMCVELCLRFFLPSMFQIKHDASGVPEFEYAPRLANDNVASVETTSFIYALVTNLGF